MRRWVTNPVSGNVLLALLLSIAEISTSWGGVPPWMQDIERDYQAYLSGRDHRAFSIALDGKGGGAWGWSWRASSAAEAQRLANQKCNESMAMRGVFASCKVFALDGKDVQTELAVYVSSPDELVPSTVRYSSRWENGVNYLVGEDEGVVVWAALWTKPVRIQLLIGNASESSIDALATEVRVEYLSNKSTGLRRGYARTLSADQVLKRLKRSQTISMIATAFSEAFSSAPQSQRVVSQGVMHGVVGDTPVSATFNTETIAEPTEADRQAAADRSRARIDALSITFQSQLTTTSDSLLRNHTLDPGQFVHGVVYFDCPSADRFVVEVPVGQRVFQFSFYDAARRERRN